MAGWSAGISSRRFGASPRKVAELKCDGKRRELWTAGQFVERQRMQGRLLSAAAVVIGIGLALTSPLFLIVSLIGALAFTMVPQVFQARRLLTIDTESGWMWGESTRPSQEIEISEVTRVQGNHEFQGWDPRDVIYAELQGGDKRELVSLRGTNEELAVAACQLIGAEIGRPALYIDQFGNTTICDTPAA